MGLEQSNQGGSSHGAKSSANKADRLRRGKSVPEQRWSGDAGTPDQRPGSASPGHSICSDSDLPYISYTVSRPIGDSPKPQHKYHLSRAKSSPQHASKTSGMSRKAASKVDPNLIVVKEPLPGESTDTDPDILKLQRIPKFLPIMRGSIGATDAKDPEVFERLDSNNLYRLCLIYENYLHKHAVSVEADQKALLEQIKEIHNESNRLIYSYSERQKAFARYADQLSKVTQLEQSLNKCHLSLNKTLETVEMLNNSLPPDERLEPFVWTTG
ncbi:unnamed protein product [Bemisia tabaci]|uniref:BLOC-1-related complex subunit 5 n=1 Tax=Bemisia tabaci TaxID=7038 RepID=A0A9P0AIP1_BEMTA|nr:unnamed protein product [Bemisia tabaci]